MKSDIFTSVRVEGSILPTDLLQRVAAGDARLEGLRAEDYGLIGEKVNEATNHAWSRLLGAWEAFKTAREKLTASDPGLKVTADRWLLPFWKVLGYGPLDKAQPFVFDEKTYPVSHTRYHSPIHLVGFRQDLDKRVETEGKQFSPHGLVQEFLNRSETHLWGFVSNGLKLRILRDNIRLTRQAFVEFDLQAMFEGKQYADFALLWRVCHESRVNAEKPEQCWLELWSKVAAQQGLRALDQLRTGVENAVKALGRGLLSCSANTELKTALKQNRLSPREYYRQLLRVVYRFLFLFVAEDRELLFDPAASDAAKDRYLRFYSTARLRRMAERLRGTPHTDLFECLSLVLTKLGTSGCHDLGLPALGGLFDPARTPNLSDCRLANTDLLEAIRALAVINDGQVRRSVDYRNLGAEEFGSVYESLLELQPRFDPDAITFTLQTASGNERKTTGSHYTPTSLITCLLDSALDPVLAEAAKKPNAEAAILNLKVCDPASGSGHFLIAASHRIAKKLASVRTQEDEPAPDAVRHALRDVIGHCIFGVDINPMAVELCQVALWMESLEPGKPLSFLDHHIQCGNSLLGTTPALLARGIPDEAFEPIEGDEKAVCGKRKRLNRQQREDREQGQGILFAEAEGSLLSAFAEIDQTPDDTLEQIHAKEERYRQLMGEANYRTSGHLLADLWCVAFIVPKRSDYRIILTEGLFRAVEGNPESVSLEEYAVIRRLAEQYQFLHWHLAFPSVFRCPAKGKLPDNELTGWCGGFDVVLGNPPWERIKLQEKEWFSAHGRPDIAEARTASIRGKLIRELGTQDPALYGAFLDDRRRAEGESHLIRDSSGIDDESDVRWGLFPLCGRGDVNTYSLFAELNRTLIAPTGRLGCIVKTGIATDDTTKVFFSDLMSSKCLASLFSFIEVRQIFIDTDDRNPFCLITLSGTEAKVEQPMFVFGASSVDDFADESKRFTLTPDDLALLNPNSQTCPVFRTGRDAELTKAIYRRVPVLLKDGPPTANPWGIRFMAMFHMTNDSGLFKTAKDLQADGWELEGNVFRKGEADYLPLYESKLLNHFDHRWATYDELECRELTPQEKMNRSFVILPRNWIPGDSVRERLGDRWERKWMCAYRWITNGTNARTYIASIIPVCGVGNSAPVFFPASHPDLSDCLLAEFLSFVRDYVTRQKLGGNNVTFGVNEQLPVLPPADYAKPCPWDASHTYAEWVRPRVLELVYTAWDLKPFAADFGYSGEPFVWNDERRFQLRCELDAAFLHLYGISESDAAYILDTFPLVRKADEEDYGTYRTKDTILRLYREFARPQLTPAQFDMLKAMASVAAFVHAWKKRVETGILETGLVLMVNDALRKAYLTNSPIASRQSGRRHLKLLDWMPLAVNQMLSKDSLKIDPKSPEGLPFYIVGSSPFDLTNLGDFVKKAEEAVKVIKKIGEQKARTEVEECIDDPSNLVPA